MSPAVLDTYLHFLRKAQSSLVLESWQVKDYSKFSHVTLLDNV